MNVDQYKQTKDVNSVNKPETENVKLNSEQNKLIKSSGYNLKDLLFNTLHLSQPDKNFFYFFLKFLKIFGLAALFKILYKLARTLDKPIDNYIGFNKFFKIIFDFANIKYAFFIMLIKLFFKIIRKILSMMNLEDIIEHKRLNFILGLLLNVLLIPIAKKSKIMFYTALFFLLKNLISFFNIYLFRTQGTRMYKESKNIYYVGVSMGFTIITLVIKNYPNILKLVKVA